MVDIKDYEDVYELIGNALFQLENDTDYIAVYGKRDLIAYLFTDLLKGNYDFGYADFDVLDESLANQIYLMIIRSDCTISVEPAITKYGNYSKVIKHDAKIALIDMDECKQDVIDYCVNSDKKVVLFGESDECDCSDEKPCKESGDKTDISSEVGSIYKINGKSVDKETFEKERAELIKRFDKFDEDFTYMLKDTLLLQCAYRDRWNDILKMLW